MKKSIIFIFVLILLIANARAELLYQPLTANPIEARIGSIYEFADRKLRLDIGSSVDLFKTSIKQNPISIGADFFTYTRLRSEGKMKFPVETSDYYFGVNAAMLDTICGKEIGFRLRLAHISSHLVDGMATDTIFRREPFVYSREFADFSAYIRIIPNTRLYAGLTYVFSRQPGITNPIIPQFGFDYRANISPLIAVIAGYDFKLNGWDDTYYGVNSAQCGVLLRTSDKIGVALSAYLYDGRSLHGMFFKDKDSYCGIGFQVFFY